MRTTIVGRPLIVVLLNSWGKLSKYGDSGRIRDWLVASERTAGTDAARAAVDATPRETLLQMTAMRGYTVAQQPPRAIAAQSSTE
jgi:hypothetical protein